MTLLPLAESLAECTRLLSGIRSAVITSHVNPDGDAIGSELALMHVLRALGKDVVVINASPLPASFDFLSGSSDIVHYVPERDDAVINGADVLFILDCNAPKRVRQMEAVVAASPVKKVVIDHHLDPQPFAQLYVVDTEASSTAEILWRFVALCGQQYFTLPVAQALYTGILTDSGGFRHPRTDAELLRMTAHLLEVGVDPTYMYEQIFNRGEVARTRLLGRALAGMRVFHSGWLCVMVVTQDMMHEAQAGDDTTEGFVEHTLSLTGVKVGVLVVEQLDAVKMSFRSKDRIPANEFAQVFGGGGHLNAAGARTHDYTVEQVVSKIVDLTAPYAA